MPCVLCPSSPCCCFTEENEAKQHSTWVKMPRERATQEKCKVCTHARCHAGGLLPAQAQAHQPDTGHGYPLSNKGAQSWPLCQRSWASALKPPLTKGAFKALRRAQRPRSRLRRTGTAGGARSGAMAACQRASGRTRKFQHGDYETRGGGSSPATGTAVAASVAAIAVIF